MYEKPIRNLRICQDGEHCDRCEFFGLKMANGLNACTEALCKQAADAIEERCQQVDKFAEEAARLYAKQPRWIPVQQRLPKSRQSVLCYNEGGQWGQLAWIDIQTFVDDDGMSGFWHNTRYVDLVGQVTHWMPLPEPPKEET